jgi:hypothetical protein
MFRNSPSAVLFNTNIIHAADQIRTRLARPSHPMIPSSCKPLSVSSRPIKPSPLPPSNSSLLLCSFRLEEHGTWLLVPLGLPVLRIAPVLELHDRVADPV